MRASRNAVGSHEGALAVRHVPPLTVLSGFLGAGKTTLLARLARAGELQDTLILVNEAGDVSIDGTLLRAARADVLDLSGGAACCLYDDEDELLASLTALSEQARFRRVLLETSGLAHPAGLLGLLRGPALQTMISLTGFAVVVDVERATDYLSRYEEARAQVRAADRVVLSKAIDPDEPRIRGVRDLVMSLNPDLSPLLSTTDSESRLGAWLWQPRTLPWPALSRAHGHAEVFSVSLVDYAAHDVSRLVEVLEEISPILLRVKGFVHVQGQPRRAFIEWTGTRLEVSWGPPFERGAPRTELVVIAAGDGAAQAALDTSLKACRTSGHR